MPEPESQNAQKLVHVPNTGVMAFPVSMPEDEIAGHIRAFKKQGAPTPTDFSPNPGALRAQAKERFGGLATEQSEHTRQLKRAQPLSTAVPKLPNWATQPLINDKDLEETPQAAAETARSQAAFKAQHPKIEAALKKGDNPYAIGALQGAKNFAHDMTSPMNMGSMAAAPESQLLGALFTMQALTGTYKSAQAARQAHLQGNNTLAAQYATEALLGLGTAGLAGRHAMGDVPLPEPLGNFLRNEEGTVGNPSAPKSERTYEEVQRDIDDEEDKLERSGDQVTNLYFPEHADVLKDAPGWKPMPENLVKLYAERDAIGSGQLKQSITEITDAIGKAGIKKPDEMARVLDLYSLDAKRTDAAKQYLASEYTMDQVNKDPREQAADVYSALAPHRNIPMDDRDDLWRDRDLTRDSIAIVKGIVSYFKGGEPVQIKGILPEGSAGTP